VLFYLVRAARAGEESTNGFRVTLHELPVLDDAEPLAS
jgi:hypothetical protein